MKNISIIEKHLNLLFFIIVACFLIKVCKPTVHLWASPQHHSISTHSDWLGSPLPHPAHCHRLLGHAHQLHLDRLHQSWETIQFYNFHYVSKHGPLWNKPFADLHAADWQAVTMKVRTAGHRRGSRWSGKVCKGQHLQTHRAYIAEVQSVTPLKKKTRLGSVNRPSMRAELFQLSTVIQQPIDGRVSGRHWT